MHRGHRYPRGAAHGIDAANLSARQTIRCYRLLERTPAVVLEALLAHEVAAAAQQHAELSAQQDGLRAALLREVEAHRAALHPSMLQPTR